VALHFPCNLQSNKAWCGSESKTRDNSSRWRGVVNGKLVYRQIIFPFFMFIEHHNKQT
jgi:hypothetical protein